MLAMYGGTVAPSGWLICDGSSYGTATYPDLYGVIGTVYGGSGTAFNVPDLRGRVPVGYAASGGHTDVSTIGGNDGVAVANRRPKHQTTLTAADVSAKQTARAAADGSAGRISVTGAATSASAFTIGTNTSTDPVDAPAYLVVNYIIRALDTGL